MKFSRRKFLHLAAGVTLPAFPMMARAQAYPVRPITLVAPFPAGGPVDTICRILGEHMQAALGQPILVENVAGAAGSLGVGRVARATPDGYTLIVGQWSTHVANAAIYKLPYDTLTDFQPIALLSSNPGLIVGRKGLPANDLKELVAWLKANPEKATQGTQGIGGIGHIAGIFFQGDGHDLSVHSLSRRHADDAGPVGGSGRHADRHADAVGPADSRRCHQGLCRDVKNAAGGGARSSDRG
jgi:tripartite-type tricarboxylate transporter receptor subunit TctC